jgi:hypothetical protein
MLIGFSVTPRDHETMRVIHCRRCETDNPVAADVDGKHLR